MKKYLVSNTTMMTKSSIKITMKPKHSDDYLSFSPGQYIAISFKNGHSRTPTRCFSVVNSESSDGEIILCVKIKSNFTNFLLSLKVNDIAYVEGPFGSFGPDFSLARPLILIAGGIGVTPMMSILDKLSKIDSPPLTKLLYFNHDDTDIPFISKLGSMGSQPWLQIDIMSSISENKELNIKQGKFDTSWAYYARKNVGQGRYYICGPVGFMENARQLLIDQYVSPDSIFTEAFNGNGNLSSDNRNILKIVLGLTGATIVASVISFITISALTSSTSTNTNIITNSAQQPKTSTLINTTSRNYQSPRSSVS